MLSGSPKLSGGQKRMTLANCRRRPGLKCEPEFVGRLALIPEMLIANAAEKEYAESLKWYADRSRRAAVGFEAEFENALKAIAAHPERYPLCDDRHRFFLLKRYPFQIIYRSISGHQLLIVAVAHTSRRPGYWRR